MRRRTDPKKLQQIQQLQRKNRKLQRLCRLAADISRIGQGRTQTLQKIVGITNRHFGCRSTHLLLTDKYDRNLYAVATAGRGRFTGKLSSIPLAASAGARRALRTQRPVAHGPADGPRLAGLARLLGARHGIVYVPLVTARQSFGLLALVQRPRRALSREDTELVAHLADFTTAIIENAHLLTRLAEAEQRFRSMVENIPAIIYTCRPHPPYKTLYVSPQVEAMLGYSAKEWMDDAGFWSRVVHPEDAGRVIDQTEDLILAQGFGTSEYRLFDRNGAERWFRDEAILVRDPAGQPLALHGVMFDITGMKSLQEGERPHPLRLAWEPRRTGPPSRDS